MKLKEILLLEYAEGGRNFSEHVSEELSSQAQENGPLEDAFGRAGKSVDEKGTILMSG